MTQIIQISITTAHILALDSAGELWWRRWDKKGWNRMESPPLTTSQTPVTNTPVVTAPSLAPAIVTPHIAAPTFTPAAIPTMEMPLVQAPAMIADIQTHKDPA